MRRLSSTVVVVAGEQAGAVGDAWVDLFDGTVPVGGLEVATEEALGALCKVPGTLAQCGDHRGLGRFVQRHLRHGRIDGMFAPLAVLRR